MGKMWSGSIKATKKKVKKDHQYKGGCKKNKKLSSYEVSKIVLLLGNKFFLESSRSMGKWIDPRHTKSVEILTDEEIKERLKPYDGPYVFDWKKKIEKRIKGGR